MNNLVSISLVSRHPSETSPGWFLLTMLVLISVVLYMDYRKDKKDENK